MFNQMHNRIFWSSRDNTYLERTGMKAQIVSLFVIATSCVAGAQDLLSCGGFIRSVMPIPYARIQVCYNWFSGDRFRCSAGEVADSFRITEIQDGVCS